MNSVAPGGTGVAYDIQNEGGAGLRIFLFTDEAATTAWCADVPSNGGSGVIPWGDFTESCWEAGGAAYDGTTPIAQVAVQTYASNDICGDETGDATSTNRAICSDDQSASTPATNNQYYGKGHPGSRELAVTRGLGERGVPASICPKIIDHGSDHGAYNPAVDALIRRLGDVLE